MTTDNRTNEPTEAQVEAAAKAMYEEERSQALEGQQWPRWHQLCGDNPWTGTCGHLGTKSPYLTLARAALVAAKEATPVLPSSGVDEEALAEVIAAVIETHKDAIGTHYEGCWKYHAGCLAVFLRDMGVE